MKRGKFITLEGGEGAGKSTQALYLRDALRSLGIPAIFTREPGGTPFAEEVRNFLLFGPGRTTPGTAMAEALLFYAARADHVARMIEPNLRQGKWVVCDRFSDSTLAYQGAASGVSIERLMRLDSLVLDGLKPDLTFVLDLPAELGLARAEARRLRELSPSSFVPERDLFEARNVAFHQKLREGFIGIARADPGRCVIIDASGSVDDTGSQIGLYLRRWFEALEA